MVAFSTFRLLALAVAVATAAATGAEAKPFVHDSVHRALRTQGTVNLIVTLKQDTSAVINSVQEAEYSSKGDKIASLVSSLETHAQDTQTEVAAVLAQESDSTSPLFSSTKSFWISNQVYIKDASVELLTKLLPLSSISEIREELVLPVPTVETTDATVSNSTFSLLANEWGVTKISAPSVWDLGYSGQGVVVSSIDTGVLYTHTALKSNFRSSYGWYDPESETATPYDQQGHGTHTMGTIAGSGGIGVAPGATWISCKGCRTDGCYESDLLTCAEFITCPTDTSGNNKDCSKAPDVVSNSWGGGQGDTFYDSSISAWRAAGIVPVFSIGNAGPACGTANSPGDNANVISVGATTSADALASYSSKGPSVNGLVKPEVSAPGSSVRSAWYTSTSAYNTISGTSMACPHVTGTVALLLSAKSTLAFSDIKTAVTGTTSKTISSTGYTCGSTSDSTIPNNQFGYGRLNALSAVNSVL
jgi:subtilisin family serine protease